jgi:minichromosome maintenance protein 10
VHRKKAGYDPSRNWGLRPGDGASERQPEGDSGGATYVVEGHVVSRFARPAAELMGREEQARAARKRTNAENEKLLKGLLGRDDAGMRAVVTARDRGLELMGEKQSSAKGKGKEQEPGRKNAFSASIVKHLGFDPTATARRGSRQPAEEDLAKKVGPFISQSTTRANRLPARGSLRNPGFSI